VQGNDVNSIWDIHGHLSFGVVMNFAMTRLTNMIPTDGATGEGLGLLEKEVGMHPS
jgi:hypothetical protein